MVSIDCPRAARGRRRSLRHGVALLLLVAFPLDLVGCASRKTKTVAPAEAPVGKERIVGVTTLDGREIRLKPPGAVLKDGKVTGHELKGRPFEIPEAQVATLKSDLDKDGKSLVIRLTTRDGQTVEFVPPGATKSAGVIAGTAYQPFEMPVDQVQRVWLEESSNNAWKVIGITLGVVVAAMAAAVATKESCPFVYSWDGRRFVFDAEPYGGATSRGLERDDYSELEHLKADGGLYRLMVTNEVNETQYTNFMELWLVDHPPGVRVAADEFGGIHEVSEPVAPSAARDARGRDLRAWLANTDGLIWEPPAVADATGELRQEIVLTFPRPPGARRARLVANVSTGLWGSHMIREMLMLQGREIGAWYASLDGDPRARQALLAWNLREELFALKLEVEEPTGWQLRGVLPGGGPFIAEHRVVPLDTSRALGDEVRLRIRPPGGFWALNSFRMDWGESRELEVRKERPIEARDSRGMDRLGELAASDERFYAMPTTGDHAFVSFRAPELPAGMERTAFLHSRGYYQLHLPSGGEPDRETIRRITEVPGAVSRFAADRYAAWQSQRVAGH